MKAAPWEIDLSATVTRHAAIHLVHDALRERARDRSVNRIASRHQDAGTNLDRIGLLGNYDSPAHSVSVDDSFKKSWHQIVINCADVPAGRSMNAHFSTRPQNLMSA
jgi:hypothetical protein